MSHGWRVTSEIERAYAQYKDPHLTETLRQDYLSADARGRIRLLRKMSRSFWGVPTELRDLAVTDGLPEVKRFAATNLDLGKENVDKLGTDPDPVVRAGLVANESNRLRGLDWAGASELERLAYVRRSYLEEEFVTRLFDPNDRSLNVSLEERKRCCLAFLSSRAGKIEQFSQGYLRTECHIGMPLYAADLAGSTGARLIELMPMWPERAGLQDFVYRFCNPSCEIDVVYQFCDKPLWRRRILENVFSWSWYWLRKDFDHLIELAQRDPDEGVRELAFRDAGLRRIRKKAFKKAVKSGDRATLNGLAGNIALSRRQLLQVGRARGLDAIAIGLLHETLAQVKVLDPWTHQEVEYPKSGSGLADDERRRAAARVDRWENVSIFWAGALGITAGVVLAGILLQFGLGPLLASIGGVGVGWGVGVLMFRRGIGPVDAFLMGPLQEKSEHDDAIDTWDPELKYVVEGVRRNLDEDPDVNDPQRLSRAAAYTEALAQARKKQQTHTR